MRQAPKTKSNRLSPVFFITFLDQIAITLCFPVLTFICFDSQSRLFLPSVSHAVRSYWFGVLSAVPHFLPIVAAPLLGVMSDILGRKKLLIVGALGIVFYGVFTSISILYGSLTLLLIGYFVSGFCVRTEPIALAVVSDCSHSENKLTNMGYLQFYIAIGATIGPLLGGFLVHRFFFDTLNFSFPYIVCALIGICTVIATQFLFKETHYNTHSFQELKSSWRELFNQKVMFILIVLILTQIAWRFYYQFTPPLLKIASNYSGTQIGLFMGVIAIWLAFASSLGIKLLNRCFDQKQILFICLYAMVIGLLMVVASFYIHENYIKTSLIWLSAAPIAMGDVIIYSMISTTLSNIATEKHCGKIMGLNFIVVSITWTLTGLLGGYLFALNIHYPIIAALILFLILFVLPKKNLILNTITESYR